MLLSASRTSSLYETNFSIHSASSNFLLSSTWIATASFVYLRDYFFRFCIDLAKFSYNCFSFSLYFFDFREITNSTYLIFSISFYLTSLIVSFSFSWYIWISSLTGTNSWRARFMPIDYVERETSSTLFEWYLFWLWFESVRHFEHLRDLQLKQ